MFAVLSPLRKALRPFAFALGALALTACEPIDLGSLGGTTGGGPQIDPNAKVQVALLVPKSDPQAGKLGAELENAARLAIADLGAQIDLRVYDTAGNATTAAAQAQRAVDEGAKIILGPLRQETANSAGLAVVDEGINVLAFSNNPTIAGGNVFVLGQTFNNIADRLMGFARKQGKNSVVVVHSDDVPGQVGRNAIQQAATRNGITVVSSQGYQLSIEGVNATAKSAAAAATSGNASLFITTDANNAALPMLLQTLPDNGAQPGAVQYIGLSRWDVRPDLFGLPGAEGAWFTLPDQAQQTAFTAKYRAAHGAAPNPLTSLGYDGMAAIAGLIKAGRKDALTAKALTRPNGFNGANGMFRLLPDGTNQRALAIATVRNNQMVILEPAPKSFGGAGF